MKRGFWSIIGLFIIAFLAIELGFSSWTHLVNVYSWNGSLSGDLSPTPSVVKVVGTSTKYYPDLGRALKEAYESTESETIFVIPSSETTMNEVNLSTEYGTVGADGRYHYTVASNDILLLPYDSEGSYDSVDSFDRDTDSTDNYDSGSSDALPDTWCKLRVNMEENVAIDCYGILRIGGEVGGDNPQGATHGRYAELVMGKNTLLTMGNGSTETSLWCHGFIRDSEEYEDTDPSSDNEYTKIILNSGVTANEPMIVYDWGSAGDVLSRRNADIFIFNIYEMTNIRPKMKINHGATLMGQAYMHGESMGNANTEGRIVGPSSSSAFLRTSDGSSIIWNFDSPKGIYNTDTSNPTTHSCAISSYGNITASSFSVSVSGYDINSADYYFPIPYFYDIHVKEGTMSIESKLKFLPGSEVYVDEGAFADVNANLIIYEDAKGGQDTAIPRYPSSLASTAARLVNNGTITAENVSISATILTEETKSMRGQIKLTNCTAVTDCYECTSIGGLSGMFSAGTKHGPYSFARQCYFGDGTSEATLTDIPDTANWISRAGSSYYENVPMADISYSFDLSALSEGAKADSNFTSNLRFSVDGISYSDSATTFQVIEGEEFTLSGYYGISHFMVNGERAERGSTHLQSEVTSIVAVAASDYAVNVKINSSALTYESTIKVDAMDKDSGKGSYTAVNAVYSGSDLDLTNYVSSLARLSVSYGGNLDGSTLSISGAESMSGYYYPTGEVTISADVYAAQAIETISLSVVSESGSDITTPVTAHQIETTTSGGSCVFGLVFTIAPASLSEIASVEWSATRIYSYQTEQDVDNSSPTSNSKGSTTLSGSQLNIVEVPGSHKSQWGASLPAPADDQNVNDGDGAKHFHYYYKLTAKVTDVLGNEKTVYINGNSNYYLDAYLYVSSGGCFQTGTDILMADGSYKAIENIKSSDYIMSFDHETGSYTPMPILGVIDHGEEIFNVVNLHFADGSEIGIMEGHGFLERESRKYVRIDEFNVGDYVGKEFATYVSGALSYSELLSYEIETKTTHAFSIISYKNLNAVAEGLLSITPTLLNGFVNYFELDEDLSYNEEKKAEDIATYGTYSYEYASTWVDSYELFMAFNGPYIKVAVGKGMTTEPILIGIINYYYELIMNGEFT